MSLVFCVSADREVQRILLELLNQMDGFDQTVNVKVNCSIQSFYLFVCLFACFYFMSVFPVENL